MGNGDNNNANGRRTLTWILGVVGSILVVVVAALIQQVVSNSQKPSRADYEKLEAQVQEHELRYQNDLLTLEREIAMHEIRDEEDFGSLAQRVAVIEARVQFTSPEPTLRPD